MIQNETILKLETTDWVALAQDLAHSFEKGAATADRDGEFVAENYKALSEARVFSAPIDSDLGGGGATYEELCSMLREIAKGCPSTALALSMHMHLVAASVFKYRRGAEAEAALQGRIANEQLVLLSTGASDWIHSNGELTKVEGGYRYSGRKVFASGSPVADIMVATGRYEHPEEGTQVFHFPVPFSAEGLEITNDWDAHGMRGTGSHSVIVKDVFVPEEKIALRRPADEWHPAWNVVLGVAMPLIMSVYRGIAEKAHELAVGRFEDRELPSHLVPVLGELENHLTATQIAVDSMIALNNDYQFDPTLETANAMLKRKTLATEAAEATVRLASDLAGGSSFYRTTNGIGLEQLRRDIQAASFHPLPKPRQLEFTARVALGNSPV